MATVDPKTCRELARQARNPLTKKRKTDPAKIIQTNYGNTLILKEFIVCGVRLMPLSLGHIILLEQIKNPAVCDDIKLDTYGDQATHLFIALVICGMKYEQALETLNDSAKLDQTAKEFVANLKLVMEKNKHWNLIYEFNKFKEYLAYFLDSMPEYESASEQDDGKPSGNDWRTNIFIIFKKMGYVQDEILNMNMRRMFLEWAAFAETEGQIKILSKFEANQKRIHGGKSALI